jgi:membrane protease subunit HflK
MAFIEGGSMSQNSIEPDDVFFNGQRMPNLKPYLPLLFVVLGLFLLTFVSSCFFSIEPSEVGVIRRFGQFVRVMDPGLHFKLPFGIETLDRVRVEYINKIEFGFRTQGVAGSRTMYDNGNYTDESQMLTGDLNVLDVEWVVQYRVSDPYMFLFNVRDQEKTLRDVSESVMREIIGDYSFNEALTEKRSEINVVAQQMMQQIFDKYKTGITVTTVKLQDVNPPAPVQSAFNEVNSAKQEMEQMVNQAWQVYNQRIPSAKGEALKIVSQAEGYAQATVNKAQGDAERFKLFLSAYQNSKDITRRRVYLDNMREILASSGRVFVIDPSVKGVVPLLDLNGKNAVAVQAAQEGGAK